MTQSVGSRQPEGEFRLDPYRRLVPFTEVSVLMTNPYIEDILVVVVVGAEMGRARLQTKGPLG